MQLAVDGQATPEQQAKLREIVKSPEQQAIYDGLRQLARELDAVPLLDPPGLRGSVLSRLQPAPVTPIHSRRKAILAFVYAAAAVVIIGIAIHHAMPQAKNAAATMVSPDAEEWPVVAQQSYAGATMSIRRNGEQFIVDVSGPGEGPVVLQWDGRKLSPETGKAVFHKQPIQLRLQRRPGSSGPAVIALQLPSRPALQVIVDLH